MIHSVLDFPNSVNLLSPCKTILYLIKAITLRLSTCDLQDLLTFESSSKLFKGDQAQDLIY